jgi:hypothetical protein
VNLFYNRGVPLPCTNSIEQGRAANSAGPGSRRFDVPASLRLWHLTSLDAPTVAVIWALAFAWVAGVALPMWVPLLLALVVWVVYIGDRLLDARADLQTLQIRSLRERHYFHHRHRRVLVPLAVAATCAAVVIVFSLMPAPARERNSVLAVAAGAYFSAVHSSRKLQKLLPPKLASLDSKEFVVGLLFASACALPALSRAASGPRSPLWPLWLATLFFAALAWLNCYAIERWEAASQPTRNSRVLPAACSLGLTGLLLTAAVLYSNQPRAAALIAAGAGSALLLAQLDRSQRCLTSLAMRTCADLVLLSPVLLIPFASLPR